MSRARLYSARAESLARSAHAGQKEESTGDDYICHIERVVSLVAGDAAQSVAWLHDIVEDTDVTLRDLEDYGFSKAIRDAVDLLTREPTQTYDEYIRQLIESGDLLAITVKLADLKDHMRPNCPEGLVSRYKKAMLRFEAAGFPL